MRRECRERFPRHRVQRKPLVSDTGMYHGTCVTHVPWCMSQSLTRGGGENVPGIPGACATRDFTYLARGHWPFPWDSYQWFLPLSVHWFLLHWPRALPLGKVRPCLIHRHIHLWRESILGKHQPTTGQYNWHWSASSFFIRNFPINSSSPESF